MKETLTEKRFPRIKLETWLHQTSSG